MGHVGCAGNTLKATFLAVTGAVANVVTDWPQSSVSNKTLCTRSRCLL
jgi:hypothetical protein